MIKNIFFLITVAILCFTYTKKLKAEEIYCGDGSVGNTVYCDISEDGKTLTISGNGKMQEYYYDPLVSRYPELTTLIVNEGVTYIGSRAFVDADNLTSITIPDSVTSIGDSAFCCASSLTSITIPDSVTSIREYAFYNASSLTSITIPDSVESIGDFAFSDTRLTSITIPDSVTSIGLSAFASTDLTSITIPEGVTRIGGWAFDDVSSLESIIIPDNINTANWDAMVFEGLSPDTAIVCQGDVERCKQKLAKYIPTDKGGTCTSNCIKKDIQPAQSSEQCNGSYIYENGNCHKRNEEQCNATDKYYYNGATCLYRPRNRQVTCVNPNYKANDGYCDRLRYTPAEAAKVLKDDNTNSVTITFKM